jgi:hypothetical protein
MNGLVRLGCAIPFVLWVSIKKQIGSIPDLMVERLKKNRPLVSRGFDSPNGIKRFICYISDVNYTIYWFNFQELFIFV